MQQVMTNLTDIQGYIDLLHRDTDGYITLFRKNAPKDARSQYHYQRNELTDEVLKSWVGHDVYMSLNSFFRPKRGNDNLRTIHNLYIDLDCYNVKMSVESVMYFLENDYYGQSIPKPNIVLHSGRGIGLIWHIEAISGLAIERFNVIQRALYKRLEELGADASALDASRIFRLPATINSKSNEIVCYDVLHDFIYNIHDIGREYFNIIPNPPKKKKAKSRRSTKKPIQVRYGFNLFTLAQARLKDLETLIQLRAGKMQGHRERLLFVARYYSYLITKNYDAAIQKIQYLNGLFAMPLKKSELLKATRSAVKYVDEETGIKLSNEKLIEWFKITADEQRQLSSIISKDEKRQRNTKAKREKRRAVGMRTMQEYNTEREKRVIRQLKHLKIVKATYPTKSIRALAERLGLSKSYVANLLKRLNNGELEAINKLSSHMSSLVKRESLETCVLGFELVENKHTVDQLVKFWTLLEPVLWRPVG